MFITCTEAAHNKAILNTMVKPKTIALRFATNVTVMLALFYHPELMYEICGPFTLPLQPKVHLLTLIFLMEAFRIVFPKTVHLARRVPLLKNWAHLAQVFISIKYAMVLVLKFTLIFENDHRKKFYLHTLLLEGTIMIMCIVLDCFHRPNIAQAGELLLVEGMHRLAIVYELTQTFCPNLVLYYLVFDLLVFILSQAQGQALEGLKTSLFVKHDVYRFLVMLVGYYAIIGVAQLTTYGPKSLLAFLLSLRWWWLALSHYDERNFKQACSSLLKAGAVIVAVDCLETWLMG